MATIARETCAGFDGFIAEQRSVPGRALVSLSQFDDHHDEVYVDRDLATVPPLHLAPRGSTALLDSLGRMIVRAGERLAVLPEHQRPATVVADAEIAFKQAQRDEAVGE